VIGLDTNILVRHLVQDDPEQAARATELIEHRLTEANPGFVSVVAMAELAWVLESSYRLTRAELAAAIEQVLQNRVLEIEKEHEVFVAMIALREGRGSFADTLIAELGRRAGCTSTLTFDRKALRLPNFAAL
jgi:predicted nucleic-acid-binding protein